VFLPYSVRGPFCGNWVVEGNDGERFGQTCLKRIGTELVAGDRWSNVNAPAGCPVSGGARRIVRLLPTKAFPSLPTLLADDPAEDSDPDKKGPQSFSRNQRERRVDQMAGQRRLVQQRSISVG
jgi:hypothetical protein